MTIQSIFERIGKTMKKIKLIALLLIAALLIVPFASCAEQTGTPDDTTGQTDNGTQPEYEKILLAGTDITEYTIVYSESGLDFNLHAAEYVAEEIGKIAHVLPLKTGLDTETAETENEIVIGMTNRAVSADGEGTELGDFEYMIERSGKKVLLYGEEYMVAAAARQFVKDISEGKDIPEEKQVLQAEFEDPNNVIFVIGDGMGFNSLKYGQKLYMDKTEVPYYTPLPLTGGYSQEEIIPFKFPNQGQAYTHSADNDVTDSAASGTALATGYKTYNGVIALDLDLKPLKTLCELAQEMGKKTGVITTDDETGATPSAFTAHTLSREDEDVILWYQQTCDYDVVIGKLRQPALVLWDELQKLTNDNGFFIMYEEAHFDKSSHSNNPTDLCVTYMRFNTALRIFLEYAMYHPDTAIIITADHETGGIEYDEEKDDYYYTTGSHTGRNVPLLGIGKGTEEINGAIFDNTGIPKLMAKLMGEENFGDPEREVTTDKTGDYKTPDADLVKMLIRYKKTVPSYKEAQEAAKKKIS